MPDSRPVNWAAVTAMGIVLTAGVVVGACSSSPREAARVLVHDRKNGGRAIEPAIAFGDEILAPLRDESRDFADLDNRNSEWVARVLGGIVTPASRDLTAELAARDDLRARLVGVAGLAAQSGLPHDDATEAFLADAALGRLSRNEGDFDDLAILALGHVGGERSIRVLAEVLAVPSGYWNHALACQALAETRDSSGIPILRECLARSDFHALPEAFRALVRLGDREAVPLVIARIDPSIRGYNSGFVIDDLEEITGRDFGFDRGAWERWWRADGSSWQIPEHAAADASCR